MGLGFGRVLLPRFRKVCVHPPTLLSLSGFVCTRPTVVYLIIGPSVCLQDSFFAG